MPPRYAYWTILIDNAPTAFRAREQAELLPTFNQLRRTNPNVSFKWFARGRLWDTPEQAQWAARHTEAFREKRGRGTDYHFNFIRGWVVERDGLVVYQVDV